MTVLLPSIFFCNLTFAPKNAMGKIASLKIAAKALPPR